MKNIILAAGITLATLTSPGMSAELVIATGKVDGGYDTATTNLAQRLTQRGYDVETINMNGSDEITMALCSGMASVGLTQIDAIDARAAEGCSLRPVGVYGDEMAVILFPPKSPHDELDDLDDSHSILVDTIGSGTDLFWRTAVRIENGEHGNQSDWAKAAPVNESIALADTMASFNEIDAVIMVRKSGSADLNTLLSRGWTLGELYDKDLNDYQFNGSALYESEKFRLKTPSGTHKEYGYIVRSFYVTTKELAKDRATFAVIAGAVR